MLWQHPQNGVCKESAVISKEQFHNRFDSLSTSQEATEVEHTFISSKPVDSIRYVFFCLSNNHTEDREQHWSQHTSLLDTVPYGKGAEQIIVAFHLLAHSDPRGAT